MFVGWVVIAALLYFPFKRWVATAEAPLISALLWPLTVAFFVIGIPLMAIIDKLKGKQ